MRCDSDLLFFIPAVFGTAALFMSLLGNFMCGFVSIWETVHERPVYTGIWLRTKLYMIEDSATGEWGTLKGCGSYPSGMPLDSKWKAAMAFSIISSVIGAFALIGVYFAPCLPLSDKLWKTIGFALVLVSLFQGLTLLFLQSNACGTDRSLFQEFPSLDLADGCGLAWGAKMCISATALWFLSGVFVCKIPNPNSDSDEVEQSKEIEKVAADAEEGEAEKLDVQGVEKPADNED